MDDRLRRTVEFTSLVARRVQMPTPVSHRTRALFALNRLYRVGLRGGFTMWLACATVFSEPLRFADVSLDTPLATLSARFPRSRH